ncbi:hypothetical protein A3I34_02715 [Candidatus Jorgensenbacteria bacterium RIFCSPLOWO2_02_FULL_45_12]|nr:MAG: hypothetical protein A3I34_02715 [Candidatus Jorgensenbacteria bacterium RIFCSPLOWO2_02_FULL_45_12]
MEIFTEINNKDVIGQIYLSSLEISADLIKPMSACKIALFDKPFPQIRKRGGKEFRYLQPNAQIAPIWAKSADWVVQISPNMKNIRRCALHICSSFLHHREERERNGWFPWGEKPKKIDKDKQEALGKTTSAW